MPLPDLLIKRIEQFYPENFSSIFSGFSLDRLGSFRINTLNTSEEEVLAEFSEKNITVFQPEIFSGKGFEHIQIFCFERKEEYAIKGTDAFYNGRIYLQSIASMLPVLLLLSQKKQTAVNDMHRIQKKKAIKILDVCSAPGSKTTQIAMMTENTVDITALEKNALRYQKLEHNIRLQNAEKSITTHKIDALKYFSGTTSLGVSDEFFDAILLDAPCSAEGRIHISREKSYGFWKLKNILQKSELQYDLITAALPKLKRGGEIVYSTCTLAPEENEAVVARILEEHPEIDLISVSENFSENFLNQEYIGKGLPVYGPEIAHKTLKIFPSEYTEGFFLAKFQKK